MISTNKTFKYSIVEIQKGVLIAIEKKLQITFFIAF